MSHPLVARLLDEAAAANARRPGTFESALPREAAERAIEAILWMHGCRSSETAAAYAYDAVMKALGIDIWKSKIARLEDS